MNKASIGLLFLSVWCAGAMAQERVYRCGNEYTNSTGAAKRSGCRLVEGGNVTVIRSPNAAPAPAPARAPASSNTSSAPRAASAAAATTAAPRINNDAQRQRDSDARTILEAELRKSQDRLTTLKEEYNDGTPMRTALELRNPQGYVERTAELKANIERTEADVEGIQRELSRLR